MHLTSENFSEAGEFYCNKSVLFFTNVDIYYSNGFSVVKRATEKATGKPFALKIVDKAKAEAEAGLSVELLKKQVEILSTISHPNVITFVKSYETPHVLAVLMEL